MACPSAPVSSNTAFRWRLIPRLLSYLSLPSARAGSCATPPAPTPTPPPRLSLVERCWIATFARPDPLNPSFIALDHLHHLPALPTSELTSFTTLLDDFTKQDQATCAQLNPPPGDSARQILCLCCSLCKIETRRIPIQPVHRNRGHLVAGSHAKYILKGSWTLRCLKENFGRYNCSTVTHTHTRT